MSTYQTNTRNFGSRTPEISLMAYVDDWAQIIGDVTVMDNAMIWPGVLIRGDDDEIVISEYSAVLDRAFIEAPSGKPVRIGAGSLISHGAIIHGATVGKNSIIGIGAILLDSCSVGDNCIVAAGSLIPPGKVIEDGSIVMGSPAKYIRPTSDEDLKRLKDELELLLNKSKEYMGATIDKQEDIKNLPKLKKKRKITFQKISFDDEV